MKKFFCALLVIVLLLTSSAALAASVPQPVLDARESVFNIFVPTAESVGMGSGFAIGTSDTVEYVVTNHHVIEDNLGVILVAYGEADSVEANIVVDLPAKDLCVLKLDSPADHMAPLTLYDGEPERLVGEQVYAIGFPGVADDLFERNQSTSESVTVTNGIVSAVKNINSENLGVNALALQVNVGINHGNSGGPLVNDNGAVVGVSTYSANGLNNATDINGAISISELLPVLEREGIPYKTSSNILYSGTLYIILAAAAAVVVFFVWFFVFRKKWKRNKSLSLADYLERHGGRFDYDQAIALLAPVVVQLDAMHRERKSHLAVYPQNIRVQLSTGRGTLAALKGQGGISNGYSAPEQYREFEQTGPWTDIYQLGAVFYRLLTGERLPDVMARMENDEPVRQKIEALPVHSGIKQALRLSVALKPDIRIENADQFMTVFHIQPDPAFMPEQLRTHIGPKKLTSKAKKRILALGIAGAAAAVVVIGAVWFVSTNNKAYHFLEEQKYAQAYQEASKLPSLTQDIEHVKRISEAGMLTEEGEYEKARTLLNGLEQLDDAKIILSDLCVRHGFELIASGEFENGEKMYNEVYRYNLDIDPSFVDYSRACAYAAAGDYAYAEEIFLSLGDYGDAYTQASLCAVLMAQELIGEGQFQAAVTILAPYEDTSEIARDILEDLRTVGF